MYVGVDFCQMMEENEKLGVLFLYSLRESLPLVQSSAFIVNLGLSEPEALLFDFEVAFKNILSIAKSSNNLRLLDDVLAIFYFMI